MKKCFYVTNTLGGPSNACRGRIVPRDMVYHPVIDRFHTCLWSTERGKRVRSGKARLVTLSGLQPLSTAVAWVRDSGHSQRAGVSRADAGLADSTSGCTNMSS